LSGGERRRTEIARCLATDPNFILLDEPFAGVDPIAVEDIQKIVRSLTDKNIGILITDHNVQQTLAITNKTYIMFEGRILKEGLPEELANDPQVREAYLGENFVYQSIFDKPKRKVMPTISGLEILILKPSFRILWTKILLSLMISD
jgi:lipopolysaccharide export system ATP-binding protein